jgi:hypothetical protein
MATKKNNTEKKKATKKTTAKKTTKKVEKPVEEIDLVGATEEKVLEVFNNMKEDDTVFLVGDKKEDEPTKEEKLNNLSDFKKIEPYTKVEVMNGDPAVVTPVEEELKEEEKPVEEPKNEPKKKITRRINRAIGYFWNGQMIDF